jgi:hypothetical protein
MLGLDAGLSVGRRLTLQLSHQPVGEKREDGEDREVHRTPPRGTECDRAAHDGERQQDGLRARGERDGEEQGSESV